MTTDRDPVVGAVLDLLPVDPPGPAFWDDLHARLEGDGGAAVVDLRGDPQGPASRRRMIIVLGAAAALLVAVVVGSALRDGRDDVDTAPIDTPTTTDTAAAPSRSDEVVDAAWAWVRAIDAGDADGAWALVGPQSRESLGGRPVFDQLMASALPEGWGAWDQPNVTMSIVGLTADPQVWMVALSGEIEQEGVTAFRTIVTLVTLGDTALVEPFVPGQGLDLVEVPLEPDAEGAEPFSPGDTVTINVDADALGVVVLIDSEPVPDSRFALDADQAPVGFRLPDDIAPGLHHLALGMVTADGTLALASYQIEVAQG